jgi:hypothetical protein
MHPLNDIREIRLVIARALVLIEILGVGGPCVSEASEAAIEKRCDERLCRKFVFLPISCKYPRDFLRCHVPPRRYASDTPVAVRVIDRPGKRDVTVFRRRGKGKNRGYGILYRHDPRWNSPDDLRRWMIRFLETPRCETRTVQIDHDG